MKNWSVFISAKGFLSLSNQIVLKSHVYCMIYYLQISSSTNLTGAAIFVLDNGVFSKWSRTFVEFTGFREFRESEKSLRHELGSVLGSALLPVALWLSGRVSVSYTGDPRFQPCNFSF